MMDYMLEPPPSYWEDLDSYEASEESLPEWEEISDREAEKASLDWEAHRDRAFERRY